MVKKNRKDVDVLVNVSKEKMDQSVASAQSCNTSFEKIASSVNQVYVSASGIASASKEQAQGIEEVTTAIGEIDKGIQHNSTIAAKSAKNADELNGQARELSEAVDGLNRIVKGA